MADCSDCTIGQIIEEASSIAGKAEPTLQRIIVTMTSFTPPITTQATNARRVFSCAVCGFLYGMHSPYEVAPILRQLAILNGGATAFDDGLFRVGLDHARY